MDSMWNDHGMINSIWNPTPFHMYSTGFHGKSRWIPWNNSRWIPWNNSIWIPLKFHMENTMIFVVKNSVKYENWTLNSMTHHVCEWENTLTAAPSDHWKTIKWPQYILCTMATAQIKHRCLPMLDLGVNKQQPPSSSTTTTTHDAHPWCPLTMPTHNAHSQCPLTMPTHNAHPWHPPIITTPPPTTDNHLDMLVHHPNDAGTPRQQPRLTTMMTDHNHNHNRQQPCHNNSRMTPCDKTTTWPQQHTTHERHQWRWAPNTTPLPTTLRAYVTSCNDHQQVCKHTPPPTFFADREARCHVADSDMATKY